MVIYRKKEGSNQLVTPQSKIVGESGVDTKSSVGELEKLNGTSSENSGTNNGNSGTSSKNSGTNGGNIGTSQMVNDGGNIERKTDYSRLLLGATVRAYTFGALTVGYFVGIRTLLMPELDKRDILPNLGATAISWYGTYCFFTGKKHALLYIAGGIALQYFNFLENHTMK